MDKNQCQDNKEPEERSMTFKGFSLPPALPDMTNSKVKLGGIHEIQFKTSWEGRKNTQAGVLGCAVSKREWESCTAHVSDIYSFLQHFCLHSSQHELRPTHCILVCVNSIKALNYLDNFPIKSELLC